MRLIALIWCFAGYCIAQQQNIGPTTLGKNSRALVRVVDGSEDPEKIPDGVAWLMLFATISDRPNAPAYATRAAFIRGSGLTESQIYSVIALASQAEHLIREMESKIKATDMDTDAKTSALRTGRDSIVAATVETLMPALGHDGAAALQKYVAKSVKTRIKMELPQD